MGIAPGRGGGGEGGGLARSADQRNGIGAEIGEGGEGGVGTKSGVSSGEGVQVRRNVGARSLNALKTARRIESCDAGTLSPAGSMGTWGGVVGTVVVSSGVASTSSRSRMSMTSASSVGTGEVLPEFGTVHLLRCRSSLSEGWLIQSSYLLRRVGKADRHHRGRQIVLCQDGLTRRKGGVG